MSALRKKKQEHHDQEESKLHGAFVSVLILGAIIVVSWVAIYFLFLSR